MKLNLPYKSGTVQVTSPYGMRTLSGVPELHKGIDLVGTVKTIVSPCAGKIGWAGMYDDQATGGRTWEWGNYVRIETDDGYMVYLCHMSSVSVRTGQRVQEGDRLGIEGSTGKSTGSHVHFEVRKNGKSVDPTPFMGIENKKGSHSVESVLVCRKAGLEGQTKAYMDKYKYASDLWKKLWGAMK